LTSEDYTTLCGNEDSNFSVMSHSDTIDSKQKTIAAKASGTCEKQQFQKELHNIDGRSKQTQFHAPQESKNAYSDKSIPANFTNVEYLGYNTTYNLANMVIQ